MCMYDAPYIYYNKNAIRVVSTIHKFYKRYIYYGEVICWIFVLFLWLWLRRHTLHNNPGTDWIYGLTKVHNSYGYVCQSNSHRERRVRVWIFIGLKQWPSLGSPPDTWRRRFSYNWSRQASKQLNIQYSKKRLSKVGTVFWVIDFSRPIFYKIPNNLKSRLALYLTKLNTV